MRYYTSLHFGNEKANGSRAVSVRIRYGRESATIPLGFSVFRNGYKDGVFVKPLHNQILHNTLQNIEEAYLRLRIQGKLRASSIRYLAQKVGYCTLIDFLDEEITPKLTGSTAVNYDQLRKNLKKFDPTVTLDSIDVKWIKEFEAYMKGIGYAHNTKIKMHRLVRATLNLSIKYGLMHSINPYHHYDIPKEEKSKIKTLTQEQVTLLSKYTSFDNKKQLAVDLWMFAYYAYGMRISDVIGLRKADITEDRIQYRMKKLKGSSTPFMEVPLHENLMTYIRRYKYSSQKYIFPVIPEHVQHGTAAEERLVYNAVNAYRTHLKAAAAEIGIEDITYHMARYTFANTAQDKGLSDEQIQLAMNHSDVKTTRRYLSDVRREKKDLLSVYK